jgi:hypothetical protein
MTAQKESLGDFLQRCDLVKFARYEPGEPELRDLHASALRLVEETEPVVGEPGGGAHSGPGSREPALESVAGSQIPIRRQTPDSAIGTPHSSLRTPHSALE